MNSKRVLIADDDSDLVNALARRCSKLGLTVHCAYDAASALSAIVAEAPSIVVLDITMPHGSGLGLCETIAGDERLRQIPVVIMTGRQDEATVRRCHDLMAYYVPKCADVWSRLEPILRDVLQLDPPPPAMATPKIVPQAKTPESDNASSASPVIQPKTSEPAEVAEEEDDSPFAAIFTELALDSGLLGMKAPTGANPDRGAVLLVDDDLDFSDVMNRRFDEQGVDLLQAYSGMDGYNQATQMQLDAILLDHDLPRGNGADVLRRLKESAVTRQIPVLILTGSRDATLQQKLTSMGAAVVLKKPISWDNLWAQIRQHTRLPRKPVEQPVAR